MISRDDLTDYPTKQSLTKPFKLVVLVSCSHIPFRARRIVREYLCSGNGSNARLSIDTQVIITDIIVRELGFLTKRKACQIVQSKSALERMLEAESARAAVTYVREFHTYGSMRKIRASKPDLIVDISEGAEVHEVVVHESRLGILRIENKSKELYSVLQSSMGKEILKSTVNTSQEINANKNMLLLDSIAELLTK